MRWKILAASVFWKKKTDTCFNFINQAFGRCGTLVTADYGLVTFIFFKMNLLRFSKLWNFFVEIHHDIIGEICCGKFAFNNIVVWHRREENAWQTHKVSVIVCLFPWEASLIVFLSFRNDGISVKEGSILPLWV